jgi:hypothetical protein
VSFATITRVASQRVFIVVVVVVIVYFVIDSIRKLLGTPSYIIWILKVLSKMRMWKVLNERQII